jgi:hypothetical protein
MCGSAATGTCIHRRRPSPAGQVWWRTASGTPEQLARGLPLGNVDGWSTSNPSRNSKVPFSTFS